MPLGFNCSDEYPFDAVFKQTEEVGKLLKQLFDNATESDTNEVIIQIGLTRQLSIHMGELVDKLTELSASSIICKVLKETGIESELDKLQVMLGSLYVQISDLENDMSTIPKVGKVLADSKQQADLFITESVNNAIDKSNSMFESFKYQVLSISDVAIDDSIGFLESKVSTIKNDLNELLYLINAAAENIKSEANKIAEIKETIESFIKMTLEKGEDIVNGVLVELKAKLKEVLQVLIVLGVSSTDIDTAIENVEFRGNLKDYVTELFNSFLDSASERLAQEF